MKNNLFYLIFILGSILSYSQTKKIITAKEDVYIIGNGKCASYTTNYAYTGQFEVTAIIYKNEKTNTYSISTSSKFINGKITKYEINGVDVREADVIVPFSAKSAISNWNIGSKWDYNMQFSSNFNFINVNVKENKNGAGGYFVKGLKDKIVEKLNLKNSSIESLKLHIELNSLNASSINQNVFLQPCQKLLGYLHKKKKEEKELEEEEDFLSDKYNTKKEKVIDEDDDFLAENYKDPDDFLDDDNNENDDFLVEKESTEVKLKKGSYTYYFFNLDYFKTKSRITKIKKIITYFQIYKRKCYQSNGYGYHISGKRPPPSTPDYIKCGSLPLVSHERELGRQYDFYNYGVAYHGGETYVFESLIDAREWYRKLLKTENPTIIDYIYKPNEKAVRELKDL